MSYVKRIKELRRKVRGMPTILEQQAFEGIRETVNEVHAKGRANIQAMTKRRSGKMLRFYRKHAARRGPKGQIIGRVGFLSKRARAKVFYARFIHDGTRGILPRPFHLNAVEETELGHRQRMVQAQRRAIRGSKR